MKKGLLILVLMMGGVHLNAQNSIAHCNYQKISDSLPSTKKAFAQLEKMKRESEEELKTMQEELEKKYIKYQQEANSMNKFTKEKAEEDLNQLQQSMVNRERQLQERLQEAQVRFFKPIQDRVFKIVGELALDEKYDYVVESSTMIFASPKHDITDKALSAILKSEAEEITAEGSE